MLISVIIQIRSKLNDRIVKSDAILAKLGGKTYNKVHNVREHVNRVLISINNHPTQK